MSDIKFLAYNRKDGKLYPVYGLGWSETGDRDIVTVDIDGRDDDESNWEAIENIVLLRYTGRCDKNHREIYQGFLLRHNNSTYEVCWEKEAFVVVNIANFQDSAYLADIDTRTEKNPDGFEIVGNIYQNKELLA